jgi:hypothetical protein
MSPRRPQPLHDKKANLSGSQFKTNLGAKRTGLGTGSLGGLQLAAERRTRFELMVLTVV